MKKLIKRVAAQSNAKLKRLGEALGINLTLPITELLMQVAWQVEQLSSAAGLQIMRVAMDEEVRRLAGEERKHDGQYHRWGSQPGYVMYAGQKVPVQRPRVRKRARRGEVELQSYGAFQQDIRLD